MVAVTTCIQNDLSEAEVWKPEALGACSRFSILVTNLQLLSWADKMPSDVEID